MGCTCKRGATPIEIRFRKEPETVCPEQFIRPNRRGRSQSKPRRLQALTVMQGHIPKPCRSDFPHDITANIECTSHSLCLRLGHVTVADGEPSPQMAITNKAHRPLDFKNCPSTSTTPEESQGSNGVYPIHFEPSPAIWGICKVISTYGLWTMPFVADTRFVTSDLLSGFKAALMSQWPDFPFRTRLQRLNSIEASYRAKLKFLSQLYQFHKQQGTPVSLYYN